MREFDCVVELSFRRYSIITVCVCVCARETVLVTCARRRSSDALGFAPSSPPAAAGQISAGEG